MMRAATVCFLLALPAGAQTVVDQLYVTVDRTAITESMVRRSIRLASFLNRTEPDFSPANMRKVADRLVDQNLIRREMTLMRYPSPAFPDIQKRIESIRESRQQNESAFLEELHRYGLTREDLEEEIEWILTLLRFVDFRFRPAIEVTEEEVKQALDENRKLGSEQSRTETPGKLDELRAEIRTIVTDKRLTEAIEQWLQQTRQKVRIEYRKGTLPQ